MADLQKMKVSDNLEERANTGCNPRCHRSWLISHHSASSHRNWPVRIRLGTCCITILGELVQVEKPSEGSGRFQSWNSRTFFYSRSIFLAPDRGIQQSHVRLAQGKKLSRELQFPQKITICSPSLERVKLFTDAFLSNPIQLEKPCIWWHIQCLSSSQVNFLRQILQVVLLI